MKTTNIFLATVVILTITSFQFASAKTDPTSGVLYNEILHMDSVLFNAFNSRDINKLMQCFDPGLELYQDNIGVRNYSQTAEAFDGLFKKDYILTRKPVPGSIEVYPIKDYGAIETGQHTFSHIENGKPETATFKFMHVWQKKEGIWRITRLITYDH
jgi:hypothetical protein